jgi:hypothetical protein
LEQFTRIEFQLITTLNVTFDPARQAKFRVVLRAVKTAQKLVAMPGISCMYTL